MSDKQASQVGYLRLLGLNLAGQLALGLLFILRHFSYWGVPVLLIFVTVTVFSAVFWLYRLLSGKNYTIRSHRIWAAGSGAVILGLGCQYYWSASGGVWGLVFGLAVFAAPQYLAWKFIGPGKKKDENGQEIFVPQQEQDLKSYIYANDPFRLESTLHGDARFAWFSDFDRSRAVRPAVFIEQTKGTLLGWLNGKTWLGLKCDEDYIANIYSETEGHELIIGPSGSGKFQTAIAPLLLTADDASMVVFDVKNGEATNLAWRRRSMLGPTLVLDPFNMTSHGGSSLNPLDLLKPNDPRLLENAKRLTEALLIFNSDGSNEAYFDDQARDLLTAILVHVATDSTEAGQRTLKRVREIIRRPLTDDFLANMAVNDAAGGIVRDTAENIKHAIISGVEKNNFYVQQTLRANTSFLDLPTVQDVTRASSINLDQLRKQKVTVFVVVPEREIKTVSRWLRLIYVMIMESVRSQGAPMHIIMDEFPSMGYFPRVVDDMARVRYLGVNMSALPEGNADRNNFVLGSYQSTGL